MTRKPQKGYFVQGQFVAEGSELDLAMQRELKGDRPSKTERKRGSTELQALGEQLLDLGRGALEALALDDKLRDALEEARRITNFEGRRRQMQYLGKLMRGLDADRQQAIRAALAEQHRGSAELTEALHLTQRWRDELMADDQALARWLLQHPQTDAQQLRALIRQARKDKAGAGKALPGEAQRQGRAYREIYQLLHGQLGQVAAAPHEEESP
jgi:ribosome-associated protein